MIGFRIGVVSTLILTGCGGPNEAAHRQPIASLGSIEIYDAYAPAPAAPDVGSLYFTVINTGSKIDTLTAIETSVGLNAALHEVVDEGGTMRMHPTGPVPIAAGDTLRLNPGGYHVMLTGLSHRPQVGDTIDVALTFYRASRISISVPVLTYTDVVRLLEKTGGHEP
jgi:copper(I)-binding protein